MAGKAGAKNWDDVKMVLTTISITATIGLWNVFAAPNEKVVMAKASEPTSTPIPTATQMMPTPTPTEVFTGKILLGGKAPVPVVIAVEEKVVKNNQRSQPKPDPVGQTHSS